MDLVVGNIFTGKVTGITKFGAFVTISPGKSGLVHISEITTSFVNDVSEFLSEGQEVSVKLISIDSSGRLNLSIKQALPGEVAATQTISHRPAFSQPYKKAPAEAKDQTFEDRLKRFIQDSDSKMSEIKQQSDRRGSRRRNGR